MATVLAPLKCATMSGQYCTCTRIGRMHYSKPYHVSQLYSILHFFPTQSSSETTSNGLLTTIERAAHSDDESAPPSLNPSAAAVEDDLPNYENVSTSPAPSSSTKIPTPSRFADSSTRINTSQFAIKQPQRASGTSTPQPQVSASAEPAVRRPSSALGSRSVFLNSLNWTSFQQEH